MTKNNTTIRRSAGRVLMATAVAGAGLAMGSTGAQAADGGTWDALAQCESGGNWRINTGNGYAGGLQFSPRTWAAYGGTGSPANASREQQIAVAERVLAGQGWNAWPACSAKLGLRGKAPAPKVAPAPAPKVAPAPAPKRAPQAKVQYQANQQAPIAPAPRAARAGSVPLSGGTYTVQEGDTLSAIANKLNISGGWALLADANADSIANPHLIFPGQVLKLPA